MMTMYPKRKWRSEEPFVSVEKWKISILGVKETKRRQINYKQSKEREERERGEREEREEREEKEQKE